MAGTRQLHRFGFASLLAVGVVFLSHAITNTAHATCGDYLMIAGEDAHHFESGAAAHSGNGSHPESPMPCHGPGCRQVPQAPLPSAPDRSITYDLERWCASLSNELPTPDAPSRFNCDDVLLIPTGYESRIDRPPRG